MKIGHHAGDTVRYNCSGIVGGFQKAAFDVDMGVNESGTEKHPIEVNGSMGRIVAESDNETVRHRHVSSYHLVSKHVDDLAVGESYIHGSLAFGEGDALVEVHRHLP